MSRLPLSELFPTMPGSPRIPSLTSLSILSPPATPAQARPRLLMQSLHLIDNVNGDPDINILRRHDGIQLQHRDMIATGRSTGTVSLSARQPEPQRPAPTACTSSHTGQIQGRDHEPASWSILSPVSRARPLPRRPVSAEQPRSGQARTSVRARRSLSDAFGAASASPPPANRPRRTGSRTQARRVREQSPDRRARQEALISDAELFRQWIVADGSADAASSWEPSPYDIANHPKLLHAVPHHFKQQFVEHMLPALRRYVIAAARHDEHDMHRWFVRFLAAPGQMLVDRHSAKNATARNTNTKLRQLLNPVREADPAGVARRQQQEREQEQKRKAREEKEERGEEDEDTDKYEEDEKGDLQHRQRDEPVVTQMHQRIKRSIRHLREGYVSKAVQDLLNSAPMVDLTDAHKFAMIAALHPAPPPQDAVLPAVPDDAPQMAVADTMELVQFVDGMRTGSAPGPSGWTAQMLYVLVLNPACRVGVVRLLQDITNGTLPASLKPYLLACRLTGLDKNAGQGVRPIAMGELFYRVAGVQTSRCGTKQCARTARPTSTRRVREQWDGVCGTQPATRAAVPGSGSEQRLSVASSGPGDRFQERLQQRQPSQGTGDCNGAILSAPCKAPNTLSTTRSEQERTSKAKPERERAAMTEYFSLEKCVSQWPVAREAASQSCRLTAAGFPPDCATRSIHHHSCSPTTPVVSVIPHLFQPSSSLATCSLSQQQTSYSTGAAADRCFTH